MDVKSGRFMYQSGRAGDETKKRKSPAKSRRVGLTAYLYLSVACCCLLYGSWQCKRLIIAFLSFWSCKQIKTSQKLFQSKLLCKQKRVVHSQGAPSINCSTVVFIFDELGRSIFILISPYRWADSYHLTLKTDSYYSCSCLPRILIHRGDRNKN